MRLRVVAIALLCGAALNANAAELQIADDRMAVINGERTFILGLYEQFNEPGAYQPVADAGFNLLRGSQSEEMLDRFAALNVFAWMQTGDLIDLSEDRENRETRLRAMIERFKNHPALLVWEAPDEALWRSWYDPVQWRMMDEPRALRDLAMTSNSKRATTESRKVLGQLETLYAAGRYEEAEKIADEYWKTLGKEQPHPELSIANSPIRAEKMRLGTLEGYRFLKTIDSENLFWVNHAPRNQIKTLAKFNEAADIVGCDIYPAPSAAHDHSDIADQTISAVGAYTLRMQAASPEKPVWMVLQGFGWNDILKVDGEVNELRYRRPNAHELRFMAYDAIVRGARGMLYWGTTFLEKPSRLWNDILALVRELADLQPVLSAPEAALTATLTVGESWGSADRTVEMLTKDVDGRIAFIVVNEWNERLDYTISGLEALDGAVFENVRKGLSLTVTGGTMGAVIPGYGVHVLRQVD